MDKLLKIYTYVDGINDIPFPNAEAQIEIFSFNYSAKRMGGAPTLTATVMYNHCLDKLWTGKEYVTYNNERYVIKQTPTSSFSHEDARYKHSLEFVSMREVLNNTYFYDVVGENTDDNSKPISNNTNVHFFGDVREFAKRLNASLKYTGLGYTVEVDEDVTSEEKEVLFTDKKMLSVLQEIYKQYEVPYYFSGDVIHIGYSSNTVDTTFKYGCEHSLLSIEKTNANFQLVNRCTGIGGDSNIPYYYPNEYPLGKVNILYNDATNDNLVIVNDDLFARKVSLSDSITRSAFEHEEIDIVSVSCFSYSNYKVWQDRIGAVLPNIQNPWWLVPTFNYTEEEKLRWEIGLLGGYSPYNEISENVSFNKNGDSHCFLIRPNWDMFGGGETAELPSAKMLLSKYTTVPEITMYNDFVVKHYIKTGDTYNKGDSFKELEEGVLSISEKNESVDGYIYTTIILQTVGADVDLFDGVDFHTSKIEGFEERVLESDAIQAIAGCTYEMSTYFLYVSEYDEIGGEIKLFTAFGAPVTRAFSNNEDDKTIGYSEKTTTYVPKHRYIKIGFDIVRTGGAIPTLNLIRHFDTTVVANFRFSFRFIVGAVKEMVWQNTQKNIVELSDYGLEYNATPNEGDIITFKHVEGSLIPFQKNLMPAIYRDSKGKFLFYNAVNDTYKNPETGKYYVFDNEYSDDNRREHKTEFEDIKPSIEFVRNADVKPINMFLEFAYDYNDSDEVDSEGNYIHPYFFAKLRKFNGNNGFNLFEHASEQGEMTISMTSGNCGACQFVIAVDENTKKNTVQVDEQGILVRDDFGAVMFGSPLDKQNDTVSNEVWIALKKDASTYPDIMPNASFNYKPKACSKNEDETYNDDGDTFTIVNIAFPKSYIYEAEKRLEEAIVKYMYENNSEKFTFSIKFSRIYLAENPHILAQLNENARIQIEYDNSLYALYVSSYTYRKNDADVLPEITVELSDSLVQGENAIQQALGNVERRVVTKIEETEDNIKKSSQYISKTQEDYATGLKHFEQGATFGKNEAARVDENGNADLINLVIRQFISTPTFIDGFAGQGFKLWVDDNGKTNLTVDNITTRDTFKVFEMLVTKLRAVNGGLFISAANGTISKVEESEDGKYYIVTMEHQNTFVAGDYMRCQVMSGGLLANWWVEISDVEGLRIKILKSEFNGSMPFVGQEVVLCGSRNAERQNAIHISSSNDGQPRISIYNGIYTKSLFGCLRTQLGNLDNIQDELLKPQGDGLYSDNAYLKGEFVLKNSGESVETKFAIQEGSIKSSVEQTQAEALKGKTLLSNASFTKGLSDWLTSDDHSLYFTDGSLMLSDGNTMTGSVYVSAEPIYNNVFFVTIENGWIQQSNFKFVNKPAFEENGVYPLFFSVNVRCHTGGALVVKVGDKEIYNNTITPSDDFVSIDAETTWNGSGNFYLSFSGKADFYGITIYTEKTEVRHRTLFEQTDKLIKISAENFDSEGKVIESSSIVTEAKMNTAFSEKFNADGSLKSTAGLVTATELQSKIESGETINNEALSKYLEGYVQVESFAGMFASAVEEDTNIVKQAEITAFVKADKNGNLESGVNVNADNINLTGYNLKIEGANFKIREDGSIEAKNALFNGFVQKGTYYITDENKLVFFTVDELNQNNWSAEVGTLSPIIVLKFTEANKKYIRFTLPGYDIRTSMAATLTLEDLAYIRSFIGSEIFIYNYTENECRFDFVDRTGNKGVGVYPIGKGEFIQFKCNFEYWSTSDWQGEFIYWEVVHTGKAIPIANN